MQAQATRWLFTVLSGSALWLAAGVAAAAPTSADCAAAGTQSEIARCAYEEFLAADRIYVERYAALAAGLRSVQRDRLRRMQQAWVGYRTAACRFESDPVKGHSAQPQVYWHCAARMTLDRAEALDRLAHCAEGDLACNRPVR